MGTDGEAKLMAKIKANCTIILSREAVRQLIDEEVVENWTFDNLEASYVIANDADDDKFLTVVLQTKPKPKREPAKEPVE
jgi:hypothetical protein